MEAEHVILNHYNLVAPYPTSWPAQNDDSDSSNDGLSTKASKKTRSRSIYSALERCGSDRRSFVPGSEKSGDGVENLVQKDEADPLGSVDSVVRVLRQNGIAVEEDQRLREITASCHTHSVAHVDLLQAIAFFYLQPPSHQTSTYLKFTQMLLHNLFCKDWNFCHDQLTRNPPR